MSLRDLLAFCATQPSASEGNSCIWVFGPHPDGINLTVPGPTGLDSDVLNIWGRTLCDAITKVAADLTFIPTALVVSLPDRSCPILDGAAIEGNPAWLLLTAAPANLIGLDNLPADSVATSLLAQARHIACARFN